MGSGGLLKTWTNTGLRRLGYELRKLSSQKAKYSGIPSLDFGTCLRLYLQSRELSDFCFIQIGANDGISNDPIHDLAVGLQLSGLVVEPLSPAFAALKANYAGCERLCFENAAISAEDGEAQLFTIRKDLGFLHYVNQASSFNRQHTVNLLRRHIAREAPEEIRRRFRKLKMRFDDCVEPEPVRAVTFSTLLRKHAISRYDFLQIDAEGFDYEVLKMADIETYRPSLIHYEHEHLSDADRIASWDYLRRLRYELFTDDGDTAAYLWKQPARDSLIAH
jgi:FkbM family methyltransferase